MMLSYLFQVSHNHKALGDRKQDIAGIDGWLRRQVEESVSWGGYLSCLVFGGINLQIEHHACPAHDSTLYYFIAPELRRICKKYDCPYVSEKTFGHAIWEYHKML